MRFPAGLVTRNTPVPREGMAQPESIDPPAALPSDFLFLEGSAASYLARPIGQIARTD